VQGIAYHERRSVRRHRLAYLVLLKWMRRFHAPHVPVAMRIHAE
jgi:hypothetical protein